MAYNSWRGASPVGYGIGAGLARGLAQGGKSFIDAFQQQNQLANEVAHQKAEEEYRKNQLAEQAKARELQTAQHAETLQTQKDIHASELASKGQNVPEYMARPMPAAEREQQADYLSTAERRGQGEEWKREMMDLPSQPPEMPGEAPSGFMQPTERITNPFEPGVSRTTPEGLPAHSAEYDALQATSQANREKINADQEYKAAVQGAMQELKGEQEVQQQKVKDDAEWSRIIQQGKDRIRASATAGTGSVQLEQAFKIKMGQEYQKQHPEYKTTAEAISHLEQLEKLPAGGGPPEDKMKMELFKGLVRDLSAGRKQASDPDVQMMNKYLELPPSSTVEQIETKINAMMGGGSAGKMTAAQIKATHPEATDEDIAAYLQGK